MTRRTPPKRRHRERPAPQAKREQTPQPPHDTTGSSAPSHLAGSFDDSGHGSGHGAFGFTQHVLP